jgi:hypothetical protein
MLQVFGIESLTRVIENSGLEQPDVVTGGYGAQEAMHHMNAEDRNTIRVYSEYLLALFDGLFGRRSWEDCLTRIDKDVSPFMAAALQQILSNRQQYVKELQIEQDVLGRVLHSI